MEVRISYFAKSMYHRNLLWLLIIICSAASFSCAKKEQNNDGFQYSATGVPYRKSKTSCEKRIVTRGEVLIGDLLLRNRDGSTFEERIDWHHVLNHKSPLSKKMDPIFLKLCQGDTLEFRLPAQYLLNKQFLPKASWKELMPCRLIAKSKMSFVEYESIQQAALKEARKTRSEDNEKTILAYLEKHQLTAKKFPFGVYYQIHEVGTGPKPTAGQLVTLNYTVSRIPDDFLVDSSKNKKTPFRFVTNHGAVIVGLDKSVRELPIGTKATLFIPSELAYGEERKGEKLPANSNLKFEIEVVSAE